jgi:hypothetical protein
MPATSVWPPRLLATAAEGVSPAATRYAAVRSDFAVPAGASSTCFTPELCVPGGNPVIAEPGASPMLPAMTEEPVLVIVPPARTA